MSRTRFLPLVGVVILLLLIIGATAWWCLKPKKSELNAAELVPGDTYIFASIPDAQALIDGYSSSKVKTVVDNPNFTALLDLWKKAMGDKAYAVNAALFPYMDGQSFAALTHIDPDHSEKTGFIAALHPKPGLDDFDGIVAKLKEINPALTKNTTTGKDSFDGVDYEWLLYPDKTKLCLAKYHGWIVTTFSPEALQDWIERIDKKSTTPSLAESDDYKKSVARTGKDPMVLLYVNTHALLQLFADQMDKHSTNSPSDVSAGKFFKSRILTYGGFAIGAGFENGDIVDHMSLLVPRGTGFTWFGAGTNAFDSMKFTGPKTLLYWATSVNWVQFYKDNKELMAALGPDNFNVKQWQDGEQLLKTLGIDPQAMVDGLGANSEISLQAEWNADSLVPEAGFFIKLEKPEAWQPVLKFLADAWHKDAAAAPPGVVTINDIDDPSGEKMISLKGPSFGPVSPTLALNGPYFAMFTTENMAVRCYNRKDAETLAHNADLTRQLGDQTKTASTLLFLDTPKLLNRAYTVATPYLSFAQESNPQLADWLKGRTLPENLNWLAPVDSWSICSIPDDDGFTYYSVSGIGNQGLPVFSSTAVNALIELGKQVKAIAEPPMVPPDEVPPPPPPYPPVPLSPDNTSTPPTAPSDTAKAPTPTPDNTPAPSNAPTPPP